MKAHYIRASEVKQGMLIYPDFSKDYRKRNQTNVGNETLHVSTLYIDDKNLVNFIERDGWTASYKPDDMVKILDSRS